MGLCSLYLVSDNVNKIGFLAGNVYICTILCVVCTYDIVHFDL